MPPPVASQAAVHLQQETFAWRVLEFGEEGYDASVDVFFELNLRHTALFVHPNHVWPDPLLRATNSAECVQSVGQKLESDLLPLLGHRARHLPAALLPNIPAQASNDFAVDLIVAGRWGS